VPVGAGGFGDECLNRIDGDAGRDFTGDVTAHAVGDHEQTEIGARTVAVFVAAAPQARVRADGPGKFHVSAEW
jgi:hypothetical protein